VVAEGLAERPGLFAPSFIQVPLCPAIVEPEAGRVTAVAGRRVAMANQRDVAALDERSPGFLGIVGGDSRRDDQRNGKSGGSEPPEPAHDAKFNHGETRAMVA
jgi:hypothetical protein